MRVSQTAFLTSLLLVVGCSSSPRIQALDGDAISAVQAEIKRQVGIYLLASRMDPFFVTGGKQDRHMVFVPSDPKDFQCGKGKIDYDLSAVNAELTTTRTDSVGGGLAFTVPVNMVTIGGGFGVSKEVSNTQLLKYNVWPMGLEDQEQVFRDQPNPTLELIEGAPIADTLLNLRNRQIFAARITNPITRQPNPSPQPCFTNVDPDKPIEGSSNSYSLGLATTIDTTGKASIGLSVVTLTVSGEHKSVTGNTLTVSFQQHGLQELQRLSEITKKACPPGQRITAACAIAKVNFANNLKNDRVLLFRRNSGQLFLPPGFTNNGGIITQMK